MLAADYARSTPARSHLLPGVPLPGRNHVSHLEGQAVQDCGNPDHLLRAQSRPFEDPSQNHSRGVSRRDQAPLYPYPRLRTCLNERDNIAVLAARIRKAAGNEPILLADDSSPDGTAEEVRRI